MSGKEIGLLLKRERGQFLEFLSAYQGRRGGAPQKKPDEDLAREIVRILSGLANADGGTLLVGIEPDKTVTGIPHDVAEIQRLVQAPQNLLAPPLNPAAEKIQLGNLVLLKFEVTSALGVYRVSGGRSFYRIGSETPALSSDQIQNLKEAKRNITYERQQPFDASWEALDPSAVADFAGKINDTREPRAVLADSYHLLDLSGPEAVPNMAALLLFGRDPGRWHPRCGIDFVKYEGTERRYGAALNVVKRIHFEAPLVRLIDEAVGRIKEHIRERTILHDLFFRERLEYPSFAWQEAVVNAVAHRDYGITGAGVEVWMFSDRVEVRSPGAPPPPVTLEQLQQHKSIHFSRNPLIVRVLADLGYLREMGEGIPRMFHEMEHFGLRPPEFSVEGFFFVVTLHNTPVYDEATLRWLNQFRPAEMNHRQRRLLAFAYSHGKSFSTGDYERVAEVDRDTAYREIRAMIRSGIVAPLKPKSRSYRIVERL
jgi:ATP-dependent DNA helicase RecG